MQRTVPVVVRVDPRRLVGVVLVVRLDKFNIGDNYVALEAPELFHM